MALGPVEVLVFSFPGSQFNGGIIPELEKLTASGTITVIDGVFVTRDEAGDVTFVEFDQLGENNDAARLAGLLDQIESLISELLAKCYYQKKRNPSFRAPAGELEDIL